MLPEQLAAVTSSALVALQFLIWCGLARCPGYCKDGHKWNAIVQGSTTKAKTAEDSSEERQGKRKRKSFQEPRQSQHPLFRCYYRPASPKKRGRPSKASLAELAGKDPVCKGVQCRQAASWRKFCPVADLLPDSIGPQKLVALLYWFSQLTGIQKAAAYTGCDRGTVGKIYNIIRSYLVAVLQKQNTQLLGSPRHICCVDECFLAKRKPSKQLRGRSTRPMRMLVVGIVEFDHETKKETGRVVLRLVRNRSSRTLTNLVRSIVRPGTTVVTDEWRGYNGLSKAGYKHQKVNHSKNEKVNAEGLGTNPVEGLFSRVRRFLRQNYVRMPSRKNYGLLLAEYCWRRSVLGEQTLPPRQWPKAAFWRLLATMKEVVPREYLVRRASYKQEAGCPGS